jgi:5-methylcytosine-specific restriction protein A
MTNLPSPYSVTKRKPLTTKQRAQLFLSHEGICCLCHTKIVNEPWIDEHLLPLAMDGSNDMENRGPAHVRCARIKTAKDATDRAKVRRVAEKHIGAKRSSRPLPGGKNSPWKKTFARGWVRRDEE